MLLRSLFSRNPSIVFLPAALRITCATMSTSPAASAAKETVSVEYAKSARSVCKGCSVTIAKGALRLGTHAHDPRGFDSTKWYHIACFPTSSHSLGPVEKVQGFDTIKDADREELRGLEKNNKRDQTAISPLEEPGPKKATGDLSSPEVEMAENGTVSVQYAKSARSTCKDCSVNIAKGTLRLGVSAHDPRGWDSTKWYHVACFPASSHPLGPVEKLNGFDSIKNNKKDQTAAAPLEEPSPKKAKADLPSPEAEVAEKGTVSVQYAKSARSTCKGCNENIAKGTVRLGVSAHDPRGWDSTKWYHIVCFPTSSHPLGSVEKLDGFDSIKDDDRVELQELEKNNKRDQAAVGPLEVSSPSKGNAHISSPEVSLAEKASHII
uniref:Uncharacterized protein n=1 Tax=Avena sativa TaxID=4498 RepID=A0ACD5VVF0_AVESA